MFWIKNTNGKKDAVLTMAWVAITVVWIKVLMMGVKIEWDGRNYDFGTIDGAIIAAILSPTLGAYVARRYTDKKYKEEKEEQ